LLIVHKELDFFSSLNRNQGISFIWIQGEWVKPGSVVIDCGINSIADSSKANGDYDVLSALQASISSTFYVQIFCTNFVLAAFSSYVLALAKNLYKKRARIMLMKLTTGYFRFSNKLLLKNS